mgnify:CR=1 FL=1
MSDLLPTFTTPEPPGPVSPWRDLLARLLPPWAARLLQGAGGGGLIFAALLWFGDPARHPAPGAATPDAPALPGEMRFDRPTFAALKAAWELRVKTQVIQDLLDLLESPEPRAQAVAHLRLQLEAAHPQPVAAP